MNPSEFRIPEEKTQEVFTLAAQLYAKHNQSYTVRELMEAGAEAKIPPEFIQQAIDQLELQHMPAQPLANKRSKALIGLAIGLPLLAAIALMGWLVTRNAATTAQVTEASVQTQPVTQPPLSGVTQGASNFKCAGLDLTGQDLSGQNLKGADCTRAKLANANLRGANLEGANLSGAELKNANLNGANLKGADLARANLAKTNLSSANLEGANLSNTDLKGANLRDANIRGADLAGAKTEGANLDGTRK
jgi:BTB/POZ domain-containing protein KCTD9